MKFTLFLLLISSAFAQKKPITLETLNGAGRGGGRSGAGMPMAWAPDGKAFVFRQGQSLMLYDAAGKTSRELASIEEMEKAALNPPSDEGPMDWQNRRARSGVAQFSKDGQFVLYPAEGDVFLIPVA